MPMHQVQFLGPTFHPMRKWVVSFSVLGAFALLVTFGLLRGFPVWLQALGWSFVGILYCFSNWPAWVE